MISENIQSWQPLLRLSIEFCRHRRVCGAAQQACESTPGCQHPQHPLILVYSGADKAPLKLLDLVEQGRLQKGSHASCAPLALLRKDLQ